MILKLVRTPGIYLVGFMGSGKSTVGRLLADRLGWSFCDLDAEIEAEQRLSIAEIFEARGEEYFRNLETEGIRRRIRLVRSGRPMVIALGGGAFLRPENHELLEENGVTIWLDVSVEAAWRRVGGNPGRPLARDPERFRQLYQARRPTYERADFRVEVRGDDPAPAVDLICELPLF